MPFRQLLGYICGGKFLCSQVCLVSGGPNLTKHRNQHIIEVMTHIYPQIRIAHNTHPNRWYAIPLLGYLYKVILIIPVAIELWVLSTGVFFFSIVNACNIFFRGRYWKMAYDLNLGVMRLGTNIAFYLWGLTDTYPGFSLKTTNYDLDMAFNKTPNRVLATPLLGVIFRMVLLVPYSIYRQVVSLAAVLAVGIGWIWVLFDNKYPETIYEIARDSIRIDQAINMYTLGMSDTYPSWWLSMNHKVLKILLLAAGAMLALISLGRPFNLPGSEHQQIRKNYYIHTVEKSPIHTSKTY